MFIMCVDFREKVHYYQHFELNYYLDILRRWWQIYLHLFLHCVFLETCIFNSWYVDNNKYEDVSIWDLGTHPEWSRYSWRIKISIVKIVSYCRTFRSHLCHSVMLNVVFVNWFHCPEIPGRLLIHDSKTYSIMHIFIIIMFVAMISDNFALLILGGFISSSLYPNTVLLKHL